jgi:hypothetical protein
LLPTELNDVTKDAITLAVERGWMRLDAGSHRVCLTDEDRNLVKDWGNH